METIKRLLGKSIWVLVFLLLLVGASIWFYQNRSQFELKVSYLPTPKEKLISPANNISEGLNEVVSRELTDKQGDYAIAIKNLTTNESFELNQDKVFTSASLYKLWVMATAFDQINSGNLDETEILSRDIAYLNKKFFIPPEYAELTEGSVTLSVRSSIEQMITISHNYASLLLTDRIKPESIVSFLKNYEFNGSKFGTEADPPTTTASDIALFFEKLSKGTIINRGYSDRMLDVLKRVKRVDKLPKYLPEGALIAHKTGELDYFTHDGGVVYGPKGPYIIVVLTETKSPPDAQETIANISKAVYNYFEQKP